ncbi:MAG: hypothetical protein AB8B61_09215 [Cyclobacteriaceae bacterium]
MNWQDIEWSLTKELNADTIVRRAIVLSKCGAYWGIADVEDNSIQDMKYWGGISIVPKKVKDKITWRVTGDILGENKPNGIWCEQAIGYDKRGEYYEGTAFVRANEIETIDEVKRY